MTALRQPGASLDALRSNELGGSRAGRRTPSLRSLSVHRSVAAALPMNSSPSRMYLLSIKSLAWPVCALILTVEQPASTALVAKPARRLWPEKPAGSMLAAAAAP